MNDAIEPAGLPAEVMPEGVSMQDLAEYLVAQARANRVELTGEGGLLTGFIRQVLETGLEVEMTDYVGYEPHAVEGRATPNSRNGYIPKIVTTEYRRLACSLSRSPGPT